MKSNKTKFPIQNCIELSFSLKVGIISTNPRSHINIGFLKDKNTLNTIYFRRVNLTIEIPLRTVKF